MTTRLALQAATDLALVAAWRQYRSHPQRSNGTDFGGLNWGIEHGGDRPQLWVEYDTADPVMEEAIRDCLQPEWYVTVAESDGRCTELSAEWRGADIFE